MPQLRRRLVSVVMRFVHDFMVISSGYILLLRPSPRRSSARLVSVKKENLQLANVARSGSSSADNDKSSHRQPLKTPCPKESTCPRTCSENVPLSTTEFL